MPLEFVSDDIGDHASLDNIVFFICDSNSNEEPPAPERLLAAVVLSAPDKMDKMFSSSVAAKNILKDYSPDPGDENSNLVKLLRLCWQRGSFKEIRLLSEHSSTT